MHILMSSPDLTDAGVAAVNQVLQTHYLSLGPRHAVHASRAPRASARASLPPASASGAS